MRNPFLYFKTSPEVVCLAVMMYIRFPLLLRHVEDLLHERGIDICHETVRVWWNRFGPMFSAEIRMKRSASMRAHMQWRCHLEEVFVRINGAAYYLWRAVDDEGPVFEAFVTKKRDRKGALRFLRRAMKRYGRWLNNRAENSHQPFRRRERAMAKFRSTKSLQKFASIHSSVHNHFNLERHLYRRENFKLNRSTALAEWRQLAA